MAESKEKEKEFVNVFGKKFMGGPHGLGDPDDFTLRQLEDQVCTTRIKCSQNLTN